MTDFTPAQRGEVKIVKIRVIHDFYDKENDLKLRSVGDTLTVSKDRAEYLAVSYTHLTLPTT